jgi:hypothetical protein
MTTPNLNESLLAALKALVQEVGERTIEDKADSGWMLDANFANCRICRTTTLNNAKAAIEAAEKEKQ